MKKLDEKTVQVLKDYSEIYFQNCKKDNECDASKNILDGMELVLHGLGYHGETEIIQTTILELFSNKHVLWQLIENNLGIQSYQHSVVKPRGDMFQTPLDDDRLLSESVELEPIKVSLSDGRIEYVVQVEYYVNIYKENGLHHTCDLDDFNIDELLQMHLWTCPKVEGVDRVADISHVDTGRGEWLSCESFPNNQFMKTELIKLFKHYYSPRR